MPILLPEQDPTNPTTWPTPPSGKTLLGVNLSGQLTLKQSDGSIIPIEPANGFHEQTNSGANGSINPTTSQWTEQIVNTGAGGTRQFALVPSGGMLPGSVCNVLIQFPATAGIRVQIYNLNLSGALLADYTSDGSGSSLFLSFFFDGTNWNRGFATTPS